MGIRREPKTVFQYAEEWDGLEVDLAKFAGVDLKVLESYDMDSYFKVWNKYLKQESEKNSNIVEQIDTEV